jgi:hypothetical protein
VFIRSTTTAFRRLRYSSSLKQIAATDDATSCHSLRCRLLTSRARVFGYWHSGPAKKLCNQGTQWRITNTNLRAVMGLEHRWSSLRGLWLQVFMRQMHRKTIPRAAATTLALFAQLQLLWLAAVHCHELPLVPRSATFQPVSPGQQPASAGADVQCPACNVIHQSTAQATAAFSAPQSSVSQRRPLAASPGRTRTCDLPILRGRAPPLS